jgi:hypothetical protein
MTTEQIHASLDAMLENPKSKNFLNHLVRNYMPITNVGKVWETPKGDFKCVLTKEPLFSSQDILEGIHTEEFKTQFMDNLKSMFDDNAQISSPMIKLIGDRKMGVTGKETTTYMSYQGFQEFYDWVITKALKGDKHMNWLLGSIRRDSFIKRAENIQDSDVQAKVKNINTAKDRSATFSLGDTNDALSKLKEKLEKEGK